MATHRQHRIYHGILIPDFLRAFGIENTKENRDEVKKAFKKYLNVRSTADLTDRQYSRFISAVVMLISREFGIEIPESDARRTMTELLNKANDDYQEY